MPVRKATAKEMLGDKPIVMSARPFHSGLKKTTKPKPAK
jgi:hypothetical protein